MSDAPGDGKDRNTYGSRSPGSTTGMSRWAKVALIVVAVVVVLIVVMLVVDSGGVGGHQIPKHAPLGSVWVGRG